MARELEHEREREEDDGPMERARVVSAREGQLAHERDATITGMDENEALERLLAAVKVFIDKGFETHLIGLHGRRGVSWWIELKADGVGAIDLRELTEIGDQERITLYVDKVEEGRIGLLAYAR